MKKAVVDTAFFLSIYGKSHKSRIDSLSGIYSANLQSDVLSSMNPEHNKYWFSNY